MRFGRVITRALGLSNYEKNRRFISRLGICVLRMDFQRPVSNMGFIFHRYIADPGDFDHVGSDGYHGSRSVHKIQQGPRGQYGRQEEALEVDSFLSRRNRDISRGFFSRALEAFCLAQSSSLGFLSEFVYVGLIWFT